MYKSTIFIKSVFFIVLILSFLLILYCFHYNIIVGHDLIYGYGRTFFNPEHGRYVATFINSIFSEHLPYILNIHPNDFQLMVTVPVKAIVIILFCLVFANSFFVFSKKENEILKFDFGNIAFLLTYLVSFLVIFNNTYFFFGIHSFFAATQNTVFWEYSCSLFYYVILFNLISYHIVNKKFPNKKNYIFILIFAFLTGLSIEIINAPVFFTLTVLYIVLLINYKKFDKKTNLKILSVYGVYLLSLFIYYGHPNDSCINYGDTLCFKNYFCAEIINFAKSYLKNLIIPSLVLLIPMFALITAIAVKEEINSRKSIIFFILVNLVSILLLYMATFTFGYYNIESHNFWIMEHKWICTYRAIFLYFLVLMAGFYIDNLFISSEKKAIIVKVILCAASLIIFCKPLIIDYYGEISEWRSFQKEDKLYAYVIEKYALVQDSEYIKVPIYDTPYMFVFGSIYIKWRLVHLKYLHYPELSNKKAIIPDENAKIDKTLFEKDELKKLKFSKLLTHRIHKNEMGVLLGWKPFMN